jgi:hypothetical protein
MTQLIGLVLWLPLAGGEVLDVQARSGQVAYLERDAGGPVIRVMRRGEKAEAAIRPADGLDFKKPAVRGFSMLDNNRLGVIVSDEAKPDAEHQRVIVYDTTQPEADPGWWPVAKTLCYGLAVADASKLWCLGEGGDHNLLHLLGPRGKLGGLIKAGKSRLAGPGRLGSPQLLASRQGIVAWFPAFGFLVMFNGAPPGTEIPIPPFPETGKAEISFALVDNGALIAMAPVLDAEGHSSDGRAGLFVFVPAERGWRRWKPERVFPAGTRLAGTDGQDLAIWTRTDNKVEFLTVE